MLSMQSVRLRALSLSLGAGLSRHVETLHAMLDWCTKFVSFLEHSEGSPDGSSADLSVGCSSPCSSGLTCGYSASFAARTRRQGVPVHGTSQKCNRFVVLSESLQLLSVSHSSIYFASDKHRSPRLKHLTLLPLHVPQPRLLQR